MNPLLSKTPIPCATVEKARSANRSELKLHVCGINHACAKISVREIFALDADRCKEALTRMKEEGVATEALILSTCNRTEIYSFASDHPSSSARLKEFFLSLAPDTASLGDLSPYAFEGRHAVRHIFSVNAGIDSLILGENEIKAQVRKAFAMSQEASADGPNLHQLIEWTHRSGKRVRTETNLNKGTLCYGRASVMKAAAVLGSLEGKICVIIGTGKVGKATAMALAQHKPGRLIILNRTLERAEELAEQVGAEALSIESIASIMPIADVIIGAAFAPSFLVTRQMFEGVRSRVGVNHPVCLIDAAVPRILDRAIGELEGISLHDMEEIEGIVQSNRVQRAEAAIRASELIEEELDKFYFALHESQLAPAITRLRQDFRSAFEELGEIASEELAEPRAEHFRTQLHKIERKLLHEAIRELKSLHHNRD